MNLLRTLLFGIALCCAPANATLHPSLIKTLNDVAERLPIRTLQPVYEGQQFGLANHVWIFHEQQGFDKLIDFLATQTHPFERVNILDTHLLFDAILPHGQVVLQLSRHPDDQGYSGFLSAMNREGDPISLAPGMPNSARLLSHRRQDQQEHWMYRIDNSKGIEQRLQQLQWQAQGQDDMGWQQWRKGKQVLRYHIEQLAQDTLIYLIRQS